MTTLRTLFSVAVRLLKLEVGVPRRFDLKGMLVVIGCFGLLFAFLAWLDTHWILVEAICVMLLLIGVLQMWRGPAKARQTSILVGTATCAVIGAIGGFLEAPPSPNSGLVVFCNWMVIGPGAGYLGGLFIAGVSLIVHALNR